MTGKVTESIGACISITEGKTEGQKWAGSEDSCSKGLAEHHQKETQHVVMSVGSRHQVVIDCTDFQLSSIKTDNWNHNFQFVQILEFGATEIGVYE